MGLYLIILFVGIAMVIISIAFIKGENFRSNSTSTNFFERANSMNNFADKQYQRSNSAFLANEILQELEDSSEEMIKKLSSKEAELEGLLSRADTKMAKLNELLEQDYNVSGKYDKKVSNGGFSLYDVESKIEQQTSNANHKFTQNKSDDKTLNTYTPATISQNKGTNNKPMATNNTSNIENSDPVPFVPKYLNKHKDVIDLYRQGDSITEIARRTEKGKGEVQLILNLYKQSGEKTHED